MFKNRIPRGISGENVSGCQAFPRYRSGKKREEDFVADDGCEYSSSCLQCPLPACKYDDPIGVFLDDAGKELGDRKPACGGPSCFYNFIEVHQIAAWDAYFWRG